MIDNQVTVNPADILACPMEPNDAGAETVRAYLIGLLAGVWEHREGFSGKRPFGNSDWQYEVYEALVRQSFIDGAFDTDGYLDMVDTDGGDRAPNPRPGRGVHQPGVRPGHPRRS